MLFPLFLRYAIRESNSVVKIFKNFKEKKSFKPDFGAESECYLFMTHFENLCNGSEYLSGISLCPFKGIYGGFLLGVRSVNGLAFYDWDNTELIRRIEIQPRHVSVSLVAFGRFFFEMSESLMSRRALCTLLSWSHCAEHHSIYLRSAHNISSALESDNKHWLFVKT